MAQGKFINNDKILHRLLQGLRGKIHLIGIIHEISPSLVLTFKIDMKKKPAIFIKQTA